MQQVLLFIQCFYQEWVVKFCQRFSGISGDKHDFSSYTYCIIGFSNIEAGLDSWHKVHLFVVSCILQFWFLFAIILFSIFKSVLINQFFFLLPILGLGIHVILDKEVWRIRVPGLFFIVSILGQFTLHQEYLGIQVLTELSCAPLWAWCFFVG